MKTIKNTIRSKDGTIMVDKSFYVIFSNKT